MDFHKLDKGDAIKMPGLMKFNVINTVYAFEPSTGRGLYRVKCSNNGLEYALKVLHLSQNDRHIIEKEMVALNRLNKRPDIFPRCQHFLTDGEWGLLLLDWLDGTPLDERYVVPPEDEFDVVRRVGLLKKICETVMYFHQLRKIHRDLKPQNILISNQRTSPVKLIDLGLSAQSRAVSEGTIGFRAPEQEGNRSFNLSETVDVYAVGQIGWWLLTGESRYASPNDDYSDWDHDDIPNLCEIVPGVSEKLSNILEKALSFQPKERYQTSRQLLSALIGVKRS